MYYKKHVMIDAALKTFVFMFVIYILLSGIFSYMNSFSNLFYSFSCIIAIMACICLFIALFRKKTGIFMAFSMLLSALYELRYIFGEYAQDDRFIHMVYMGSYIFLFLFILFLKVIKNKETVSGKKWFLAFGVIFGIIAVLYRIWFLRQAGAALVENSHQIVISGFWMDCAHLIEEIFILLLAGWIFLFCSNQEGGDAKIDRVYVLGITPAVLFFGTALDVAYTMFSIFLLRVHHNDFSFHTMEYFFRLFLYFAVFLLMGVALVKKKKKLLSIASLLLFIFAVIWKAMDYNGAEYYIYMVGYLAIFVLNVVIWIDRKENFRYKLYLMIPILFLFMMAFLKGNQWLSVRVDFEKDNYILWSDLVHVFAIFFTMLWAIYPKSGQGEKQ